MNIKEHIEQKEKIVEGDAIPKTGNTLQSCSTKNSMVWNKNSTLNQ
jgi:hypothetical protein